MTDFRPCILIPTYNNPATIRSVVERVRRHLADVVVIDDCSADEGKQAVEALARDGLTHTHRRERNGGKGAAVKTGFEVADRLGFTHALQVDADGQHALDDIPRFIEAARQKPESLVLGAPVFDETVPKARLKARQITIFWTNLETGGKVIEDPMCGFRVYPLKAALAAGARGDRMDFDPEIAVRMVWDQVPVINLPTKVRYLSAEEGGVSHFKMFRDNALISWMHTRLVATAMARWFLGLFGWRRRARA
ncbi:MAG: glycosyltransferase family 2 protein [Myxococcales bacterium]|jgi:glycosyltransferase involved in cell wall biosynthesis